MNFTEAIVLAVEKVKAWIQSGGVKWDHVSDKPFVKVGGDTLTWDGNTEGLENMSDANGTYYRVSDIAPTKEDFVNGCTIRLADGSAGSLTADEVLDLGELTGDEALTGILFIPNGGYIYTKDFVMDAGTIAKGTFFFEGSVDAEMDVLVRSLTIPGYTGFAKEQIDPKVLPGAVVLYADAEDYLCSDSAMSKRVTRAELLNSMRSGRAMYVDIGEGAYLSVFGVQDLVEFAAVSVGMISDGVFAGGFFFYTAEYTA